LGRWLAGGGTTSEKLQILVGHRGVILTEAGAKAAAVIGNFVEVGVPSGWWRHDF
jgi:hypothetical protein